jgi:hypothetical protein
MCTNSSQFFFLDDVREQLACCARTLERSSLRSGNIKGNVAALVVVCGHVYLLAFPISLVELMPLQSVNEFHSCFIFLLKWNGAKKMYSNSSLNNENTHLWNVKLLNKRSKDKI